MLTLAAGATGTGGCHRQRRPAPSAGFAKGTGWVG